MCATDRNHAAQRFIPKETTRSREAMKNLDRELLSHAIEHFKNKLKSHSKNNARFPSAKKIRSDPTLHFAIIVEQAQKLISEKSPKNLCGVGHWNADKDNLISLFARDLTQFITEENIVIPNIKSLVYGQKIIPEKALFNIARARILPNTYETITLHNHATEFQTYSIPFLIRLSIENKIKSVIGFIKSDVKRHNKIKYDTEEFPAATLIQELNKLDCLNLPCTFEDLQEIYTWSCRFCHTGKKEYLWLNMKAIEVLSPFFAHDENLKIQINIQKLWGEGVLNPAAILEKLTMHPGALKPLFYLKKGWSIKKLEDSLNNTKTIALTPYTFYLSESALDETTPFYCSKLGVFI